MSTLIRMRTELAGTLREPRTDVPRRAPGSVRRTTVIETRHPDGPDGDLQVTSYGRDAHTAGDGSLRVLDEIRLSATVLPDRTLREVEGGPEGLDRLIGRRVAAGFRGALAAALPAEAAAGTVAHQLVDDWVGALLVAHLAEIDVSPEVVTPAQVARQNEGLRFGQDQCAGWAVDATLITSTIAHEVMPTSLGPPAPDLGSPDDPALWPAGPPLRPGDSRRVRRLDLVPGPDGLRLDVHFRDSWAGQDDRVRVVHEYSLTGLFDPSAQVLTSLVPTAHVLPWPECPAALGSAARVVGLPVGELRQAVRKDLTGTATCTHLNDVLRSLADVPALAQRVHPAA